MKQFTFFTFAFVLVSFFLFPFDDGTYTGSSNGYEGPVKVGLTVTDHRITEVRILKHHETGIHGVFRTIPERIVQKGTYEGVDTVTGATMTSRAILKAAENALTKASGQTSGMSKTSSEVISLPAPKKFGGATLSECLWKRRTQRKFSGSEIPVEIISNLLWSARGVNRPEEKKLTVPSAFNWQQIDVYVAMASGTYFYNSEKHRLEKTSGKDVRALSGAQWFKALAPVVLIYVVDYDRMVGGGSMENKIFYAATDTGFISQNVYLYCAGMDLATVVLGGRKPELEKKMGLTEWQSVILTQPVGYPER